jgi:pre-rRNA-processing protein TSR4
LVDELEGRVDPEQAHFAAFQARVGQEPAQCLRYCFDAAAQPLWPSSKNVPGPADIPPCERCGSPRQFEFQVMPQLIVHLGMPADDPAAPDWGTIAVYSCAAACGGGGAGAASPDESAYLEEFVWVQESA